MIQSLKKHSWLPAIFMHFFTMANQNIKQDINHKIPLIKNLKVSAHSKEILIFALIGSCPVNDKSIL